MDNLMKQYKERFDDQFPLMMVQGVGDAEVAEIIRECLRTGKPYEPPLADEDGRHIVY